MPFNIGTVSQLHRDNNCHLRYIRYITIIKADLGVGNWKGVGREKKPHDKSCKL